MTIIPTDRPCSQPRHRRRQDCFDSNYIGYTVEDDRGFAAYDANDFLIGVFSTEDKAARAVIGMAELHRIG
jgi:hypothetical protein